MEAKKDKKPQRSALGRGLSSLISTPVPVRAAAVPPTGEIPNNIVHMPQSYAIKESPVAPPAKEESGSKIRYIPANIIINNPAQPRQVFNEAELEELAGSIRSLGVLQPVLVRPSKSAPGKYEIIAGERRWRASQRVGLTEIPVIIHEIEDREALEIALVENVQRANLNPVEEANAYQRLLNEFSLTQQQIAERVGKDRASIANLVRLLKLPTSVLELLREDKLTMGHAKAILAIKEPTAQTSLARKVVNEGLSVRDLEAIVSRAVVLDAGKTLALPGGAPSTATMPQTNFPEVIDRMRNVLGTKVKFNHHRTGRGRIIIEYFSEQELDRIVEQICR